MIVINDNVVEQFKVSEFHHWPSGDPTSGRKPTGPLLVLLLLLSFDIVFNI